MRDEAEKSAQRKLFRRVWADKSQEKMKNKAEMSA